jgi:hypothetical protein
VSASLLANKVFKRSVDERRDAGVTVLLGEAASSRIWPERGNGMQSLLGEQRLGGYTGGCRQRDWDDVVETSGTQIYWYGDDFAWNIGLVPEIVAGREASEVDITSWVRDLPRHRVCEEHWPTVDLTEPLIVVPFPGTGELFLIDGWHRVRRASDEGIALLPAHILSDAEERFARAYPEDL